MNQAPGRPPSDLFLFEWATNTANRRVRRRSSSNSSRRRKWRGKFCCCRRGTSPSAVSSRRGIWVNCASQLRRTVNPEICGLPLRRKAKNHRRRSPLQKGAAANRVLAAASATCCCCCCFVDNERLTAIAEDSH